MIKAVALTIKRHHRCRQKRRQLGGAAISPDSRPAHATLRRAEGFVQHEHAGVKAEFTGADFGHRAIEVGVIVEAQTARLVHQPHPFANLGVVNAHVVGVIHHQRRGPTGHGRLQ